MPFSPGLNYVVAPSAGQTLPIESRDFHVETLGPLASLWARLRLMALFKKKKYLKYQEFSLFPIGPKAGRKRFTGFNQDTRNIARRDRRRSRRQPPGASLRVARADERVARGGRSFRAHRDGGRRPYLL